LAVHTDVDIKTNCDQNIYVYPVDQDTTKDLTTVAKKALDYWYSGNKKFNYETGA
jgi:hypothetical protein